jgi:hypothetical protein
MAHLTYKVFNVTLSTNMRLSSFISTVLINVKLKLTLDISQKNTKNRENRDKLYYFNFKSV